MALADDIAAIATQRTNLMGALTADSINPPTELFGWGAICFPGGMAGKLATASDRIEQTSAGAWPG